MSSNKSPKKKKGKTDEAQVITPAEILERVKIDGIQALTWPVLFYVGLWSIVLGLFLKGVAVLTYALGLTSDMGMLTLTLDLITMNPDLYTDNTLIRWTVFGVGLIWICRLLLPNFAPYARSAAVKVVLIAAVPSIGLLFYQIVTMNQPLLSSMLITFIMLGISAELPVLFGKRIPDWMRDKYAQRLMKWVTNATISMFVSVGFMGIAVSLPLNALAYTVEWAVGDQMYEEVMGTEDSPGAVQKATGKAICRNLPSDLRPPSCGSSASPGASSSSDSDLDDPRTRLDDLRRRRAALDQ